jgi:phospholipid/cholesterol/gamma-HCH transport system substrate-binding protein
MSNTNEANIKTKIRVGLFTLGGLVLMGILTIYVNNRPFWWRPCNLQQVTVEDATGLKPKSPVKSLGLDIGYIYDIGLVESGVKIKLCITAPVEVQTDTKAYVRGEGFLGDRFLELKPVKYIGSHNMEDKAPGSSLRMVIPATAVAALNWAMQVSPAQAQESAEAQEMTPTASPADMPEVTNKTTRGRNGGNKNDIPVAGGSTDMQQVMSQLNGLMTEVKGVTTSLKESINPEEIRNTVKQLNKTLETASKVLSPEGGLTVTAQRSLIKLEDAIEQLRDQMTRINQGEGSVGKILNDPIYAEELKKALINMNHLLNRAGELKLTVTLGLQELSAYSGSRSFVEVQIIPKPDRYYLIGVSTDVRGAITQEIDTTQAGNSVNSQTTTRINKGGFNFTAMIGKIFNKRFDLSLGLHYGDGAGMVGFNLGPIENVEMIQAKAELYFRSSNDNGNFTALPDGRIYLNYQPFSVIYLSGGVEGLRQVQNKASLFYGGGIRFEDEDIKLLFSFL